jgi:CheY-like chemotaxis protein
VTAVATGRQAVEAFGRGGFDLVLMDLEMPDLDGLQATTAIRAMEGDRGGHTPIYALTAHSLGGDPKQCYDAGMDGYISKPIRAATFRKIVERATPRARGEGRAGSDEQRDPKVFDYEDALDRLDGEEDLLQQVIVVFLNDGTRTMSELEHALSARDPSALVFCAHKIKGALGTLSAHAAHDAASQLEHLGKEKDFSAAAEALQQLKRRIDELLPVLAASVKKSE